MNQINETNALSNNQAKVKTSTSPPDIGQTKSDNAKQPINESTNPTTTNATAEINRDVDAVSDNNPSLDINNASDITTTVSTNSTQQATEEEEPDNVDRPSEEVLSNAVSQINDFMQSIERSLEFTIDDDSGETIVKVIDKTTEEIVRQIPPENVLEIMKKVNNNDSETGLLLSRIV